MSSCPSAAFRDRASTISRRGFLLLLLPFLIAAGSVRGLAQDAAAPAPLKMLCVGNSFAQNATTFLPGLAKAGGKPLSFLVAYKGGCSLQEHAAGLAAAATAPESPEARIYENKWFDGNPTAGGSGQAKFNLIEALKKERWDIVTIQQYSALSYKPETYEPYASQVVAAIRQYAPQAEIVVLETWSYREDDPLFAKGAFTQRQMYEQLQANYAKLAAAYHCRTMPIGNAFQAARALPRWAFVPDAAYDRAHPVEGTLPQDKGGLNNGWSWSKSVPPKFALDSHHANKDGQYLGGAVLYEVLFGADVTNVNYCPPGITPEDVATLRKIAHEVVQAQKPADAVALAK